MGKGEESVQAREMTVSGKAWEIAVSDKAQKIASQEGPRTQSLVRQSVGIADLRPPLGAAPGRVEGGALRVEVEDLQREPLERRLWRRRGRHEERAACECSAAKRQAQTAACACAVCVQRVQKLASSMDGAGAARCRPGLTCAVLATALAGLARRERRRAVGDEVRLVEVANTGLSRRRRHRTRATAGQPLPAPAAPERHLRLRACGPCACCVRAVLQAHHIAHQRLVEDAGGVVDRSADYDAPGILVDRQLLSLL